MAQLGLQRTEGTPKAHTNTDPISAEDTANVSSDLTELDTDDEEVLKEEEEEEDIEEEGNEEDMPVSNDDMVHSVIVVASGHPKRSRS
ncbi:hypothetical protein BDD12DRAFT_908404 [Trichophaea hybrida]|nr:hypothetical protein BDD12DRAFT_908404 [Trichophaea hybrida]